MTNRIAKVTYYIHLCDGRLSGLMMVSCRLESSGNQFSSIKEANSLSRAATSGASPVHVKRLRGSYGHLYYTMYGDGEPRADGHSHRKGQKMKLLKEE